MRTATQVRVLVFRERFVCFVNVFACPSVGTEFKICLVSNLILIYIGRCDRAEHGIFLEALASTGGLELVGSIFVLWGVALFDC